MLVFREGLSVPTSLLLRVVNNAHAVVNNAHAVLVLRGTKEYSYLHDDFVLSTRGEEALAEWGVGRPLFASSVLAI